MRVGVYRPSDWRIMWDGQESVQYLAKDVFTYLWLLSSEEAKNVGETLGLRVSLFEILLMNLFVLWAYSLTQTPF